MKNSNEAMLNQFEVEELEARLENKWGKPAPTPCVETTKDPLCIDF